MRVIVLVDMAFECCVEDCCVEGGHSVESCGVKDCCERRVYMNTMMGGVFGRLNGCYCETIGLCSSGNE